MKQGLVCQTCGDEGFTNAFEYCVKCRKFVVHRYCLDVIPPTFDEDVNWLCDDCEVKGGSKTTVSECEGIPSQNQIEKVSKNIEGFSVETKKNDMVLSPIREQDYGSGLQNSHDASTKLPVVDFVKSTNRYSPPQLEEKKIERKLKENGVVERGDRRCFSEQSCKSFSELGESKHLVSCSGSVRTSKEKSVTSSKLGNRCSDMRSEERGFRPGGVHIENRIAEFRDERCSIIPYRTGNLREDFAKDSSISSMPHCHATCAEPVMEPVWRGCFEIWHQSYEKLEGVMAHLSSAACQKVYEEACQFQPVLDLEMLPKSDVWPKSFQTSQPNCENIALYIFPSKTSECAFDNLVNKMVDKELAMRGCVQNAELLLFTSTELPMLYWRFQGKYYIWGVFRGKQRVPSQSFGEKNVNSSNRVKGPPTLKSCDARSPLSTLSNDDMATNQAVDSATVYAAASTTALAVSLANASTTALNVTPQSTGPDQSATMVTRMAGSSMNVPVNYANKPEKFNGLNFKRWQQKMFFYLTSLGPASYLTKVAPIAPNGEVSVEVAHAIDAWNHADFLCRNYVLNCLSDSLYNVYNTMKTAKELWESLDKKYKIEDVGAKNFLFGRLLDFVMVDSKPVISQVQELQVIFHKIIAEGMALPEAFQVAVIIEKLPPGWKDFKNYLKHKFKETNLEELVVRLRIEENNRASTRGLGFASSSQHMDAKANLVVHGKKMKKAVASGSKLKPTGGVGKKKFTGKCFNCGIVGHRFLECRKPKKKREINAVPK